MTITRLHYDQFTPSAGAGPFSCVVGTIPTTGSLQVCLTTLASTTIDVANAVAPTGADATAFTKFTWVHNNRSLTAWYRVVGASPTATFSVTPSGSTGTVPLIAFLEFANTVAWGATPLDAVQSLATFGTSNAPASPSTTPTVATDTLMLILMRMTSGTNNSGPDGGFSTTGLLSSASSNIAQQIVAPASGSYSGTWAYSTSAAWESMILVFRATPASLTLSVTQQPSTVASGAANSPSVTVQDSDNASGQTITAALASGAGVLSGTLTAVTNGSGLATFSNLVVTGAGAHTLSFSAPGYTGATSSSFTVTNAVTTAWQAFIDANGGDSAWPFAYDPRVNCVAGTCYDVRGVGAGFGPAMVQATGSLQPTLSGSGLTFDGVDDFMMSALDTRLAVNQAAALHDFVVWANAGANGALVGKSQDPTSAGSWPYQYLATDATSYAMRFNPGSTNIDVINSLGTLLNSTVRSFVVGRESTHPGGSNGGLGTGDYNFEADCSGRQWVRQTAITPAPSATGSGMKNAWGRWGTTYGSGTLKADAKTNQNLTATVIANWQTFAAAQWSIVLDHTVRRAPIWHGTSTQRGQATTHPKGWTPATQDGTTTDEYTCATIAPTWASRGIESNIFVLSQASNGNFLSDQALTFATRENLETVSGQSGNLVLVMGGLLGGMTISPYKDAGGDVTYIAAITSYIATLVAAGYKVIPLTVMDYSAFYTPATDLGTVNQAGLNAILVNQWLRTTALTLPGVVACFDTEHMPGSVAEINRAAPAGGFNFACFDTANFVSPGHPTDALQATIGTMERGVFDANPSLLGSGGGGSLTFDTSYMQQMMRRRRKNG